jgi:hypothetical protein
MMTASQVTARAAGPSSQPPHRLLQAVVVALALGAGVLSAHRRGQRVQHRGHDGRALGGQVTGHQAGAVKRGLQAEGAVLEAAVVVIVILGRAGADLGGQAGQVPLVGACPGRGKQDLIGGLTALLGELVGPTAQLAGQRLAHDGPFSQRGEYLGVRHRPAGPADVACRRAFCDPGLVDQPGADGVVRVGRVALGGGERAQDLGPGRGEHGLDMLQAPQALGLHLSRHSDRIDSEEGTQPGPRSRQRLSCADGRRCGVGLAHLEGHPRSGCWLFV